MRAVVQRVSRAQVLVGDELVGAIGEGLCALVGAMAGDGPEDAAFIARKLATLRVFHDTAGRMNRSVSDVGGSVLIVPQFTLAADTTSGTRPSFSAALEPALAEPLVASLEQALRDSGLTVAGGRFGAHMQLELTNDGPVTILLDSKGRKRR